MQNPKSSDIENSIQPLLKQKTIRGNNSIAPSQLKRQKTNFKSDQIGETDKTVTPEEIKTSSEPVKGTDDSNKPAKVENSLTENLASKFPEPIQLDANFSKFE